MKASRNDTDPVDQSNPQIQKCHEYQKKYYYKNRAKEAERHRIYRETHKAEVKARAKLYRETHKAEIKAYAEAHREERCAYLKKYRAEHPNLEAKYSQRKRERDPEAYALKQKQYQQKYRAQNRAIKAAKNELFNAVSSGANDDVILEINSKIQQLIKERKGRLA